MASPHGFSVPILEKKLKELNTTLQSIQGLSQWAIHHRKHSKSIISVWYKELQKGERVTGERQCSFTGQLL